jgi:hypothetical protein
MVLDQLFPESDGRSVGFPANTGAAQITTTDQ